MVPAMTRIVGLSGGIGSGKSTVRQMLEALGATTICADQVVHEMQAPGQPLLTTLAEAFGPQFIRADGSLDRKALGDLVFQDADARAQLGTIMHGPVVAEMVRRTRAAEQAGAPVAVLDIPLLFEGVRSQTGSAVALHYDALVLVWIPSSLQIERTVSRDQCTVEEAERRVAAQMPIDEKRALATHVIDNSKTPDETERQVRALWPSLTGEAPA